MKLALANLLHRIEWRCQRLRRRLGVVACPGCANGWPVFYEEGAMFRWRMHHIPGLCDVDCLHDAPELR